MKRRHFLPVAAAAATGTGLLGYYAWDQRAAGVAQRQPVAPDAPLTAPRLPPDARRILYLASLAPSAHNTQPWTVRLLGPYYWVIGNDPRGWLPVVDPGQRETMLSLGAFAQSLEYAAAHFGYQCRWRVLATTCQAAEVLAVQLERRPGPAYPDLTALLGRRTLRTGFSTVPIQPADVQRLTAGEAAHCHFLPPSSEPGTYLTAATRLANQRQTAHDPAQRELAHWVRWTATAVQRHRDGLTASSMGIEGPAGWLVRHFYDSARVLTPDFRQRGLTQVTDQLATHGGWLVLTSPDESVPALLEAGRRLVRIWLRAKAVNIAIHPMTQVLEEAPGPAGLGPRLGLGAPVQFVLRLGYVEGYDGPVSPRRPVEWFVQA
ncbi:Acg family FMN-binding oxidoreductase [Hymenobacter nivis]|uniref:Nitroreductase n=1 Tax=Hymenobacter nivis TaxID=1850093 RepID=A0A502G9I7_9BACT|nr:nitroreductase [Hymenobacter nivis]TPG58434.1 nitroreductase [Hymenobacter nivis]